MQSQAQTPVSICVFHCWEEADKNIEKLLLISTHTVQTMNVTQEHLCSLCIGAANPIGCVII